MAKLTINLTNPLNDGLRERAQRMVRKAPPLQLDRVTASIHFLRGALSRVGMCLPAYYLLAGANAAAREAEVTDDYPFKVAQRHVEFTALSTLTMACRKIFDHAGSSKLIGGEFAKGSDAILTGHATYWAQSCSASEEDALCALKFLREFFELCSKTSNQLLTGSHALQMRIGLLKQHANHEAAHLTLENYAINLEDIAHVVGALVMVGEIIRSFDRAMDTGPAYFVDLDAASYQWAKRVFPQLPAMQLFPELDIARDARTYWKHGESGMEMLLDGMLNVLGGEPEGLE